MRKALSFALGAFALSACAPAPTPVARGPVVLDGVAYEVGYTSSRAVRVTRVARPFGNWEGAEARRAADRFCNGRAKSSIRDRFQGDAWLIVQGCA